MTKKSTFSLYLAKADIQEATQLLTDTAQDHLLKQRAHTFHSADFGDGGVLYVFSSISIEPKWIKTLKGEFDIDKEIRSQSPSAVLVFRKDARLFASTFSYGESIWMMPKSRPTSGLKSRSTLSATRSFAA